MLGFMLNHIAEIVIIYYDMLLIVIYTFDEICIETKLIGGRIFYTLLKKNTFKF